MTIACRHSLTAKPPSSKPFIDPERLLLFNFEPFKWICRLLRLGASSTQPLGQHDSGRTPPTPSLSLQTVELVNLHRWLVGFTCAFQLASRSPPRRSRAAKGTQVSLRFDLSGFNFRRSLLKLAAAGKFKVTFPRLNFKADCVSLDLCLWAVVFRRRNSSKCLAGHFQRIAFEWSLWSSLIGVVWIRKID